MTNKNKPESIPVILEKDHEYEFESGNRKYQFIVNSQFKQEGETLDKTLLRLMEGDVNKQSK